MTDLEIVEAEIDRLEAKDTSYYTCNRLATLYTVRDHLRPQAKEDSTLIPRMKGSEFLELAGGKSCADVMKVIDEHLETIKLIYPKTYDGIMARLRELR